MKQAFYPLAFALGASALAVRADTQYVQLVASGGVSGILGQLVDGQNRIGGGYPPACYAFSNGGFTDAAGRGCILTSGVTQFQCDLNKPQVSGFAITSGVVTYNGSNRFYACPATSNGEYNVYINPVAGQSKCVQITLSTGASCGPSSSSSRPASTSSSSSRPVTSSSSLRLSSSTLSSSSSRPATSSCPVIVSTVYITVIQTPSTQASSSRPASSSSVVVASSSVVVVASSSRPTTSSVTPSPSSSSSRPSTSSATPSSSVSSSRPASSSAIPSSTPSPTPSPTPSSSRPSTSSATPSSTPSSSRPSTSSTTPSSTPSSSRPTTSSTSSSSSSSSSSRPTTSPVAPSSSSTLRPSTTSSSSASASASVCPANLSGNYQYPHLIIPVSSTSPNTAYGTSYFGVANSTVSSIFNFDIPASYAGQTCTLLFLFPTQSQLETSSYTVSGSGGLTFSVGATAATQSTTFNNKPSFSTISTIATAPGNSYVIASGACKAGQTVTYQISATGTYALRYFQDYNPSPIGLYIRNC